MFVSYMPTIVRTYARTHVYAYICIVIKSRGVDGWLRNTVHILNNSTLCFVLSSVIMFNAQNYVAGLLCWWKNTNQFSVLAEEDCTVSPRPKAETLRLKEVILHDYDNTLRPVHNHGTQTVVYVSMFLRSIKFVSNEKIEVFTVIFLSVHVKHLKIFYIC